LIHKICHKSLGLDIKTSIWENYESE